MAQVTRVWSPCGTRVNPVAATAANGNAYKSLKDAIANQESVSNLYQGFVSDIEDVDMAKALTNLNANQVALQAALSVVWSRS